MTTSLYANFEKAKVIFTGFQGISLLESLKILEGVDLKQLGHNTPAYIHQVAEALNLAFADREAYVGDPRFVQDLRAGRIPRRKTHERVESYLRS